ncbi:hypothetical protein OKA04_10035 [Luteolibacter flavescens]|uniref:Uncharacterized protein n=1 Tax=Luteolibacter flavescens TaxID=1859460 RepID=A0ABT3FP77_9BACT|nr:hypothetical protein [Luteolibacter flavescens]MCW1885066.1 hypothetical protein [Luteolibacter flavescens]
MSKPTFTSDEKGCLIPAGVTILAFLLFLSLPVIGLAPFQIAWRFVAGFGYFLRENVPRISSDAGTWVPGIVSLLLSIAVIHAFGRLWARHRQQPWKVSTSLALGMVVPLLFVISFLVPGVILQVDGLRRVKWTELHRSRNYTPALHAMKIATAAVVWAENRSDRRFPPSADTLVSDGSLSQSDLKIDSKGDALGEPPLYLGAGLTAQSDPGLPLVISGPYSRYEARHRTVITIDLTTVEIAADELDAWIEMALEARTAKQR